MIKKFLSLLLGTQGANIDPLIRQIAEHSLAEVCQLVEGRMIGMSVAEARGYVRARAVHVVLHETRLAIAKSADVELSSMADVVRQATERLIPQVIRKMHGSPKLKSRLAA